MVEQKLSVEEYGPTGYLPRIYDLKEKYKASLVWKIPQFKSFLDHYYHFIANEEEEFNVNTCLSDFLNEFKRLDAYLEKQKKMTNQQRKELQRKVKNIHRAMRKHLKKIEKYSTAEVSWDQLDDEDAPHIRQARHERLLVNQSKKLLELQGASQFCGRIICASIKYDGTPYPDINEEVVKCFTKMMTNRYVGRGAKKPRTTPIYSTPSYLEYLDLIKKVKSEKNLWIPNEEELAIKIADDIKAKVQERRKFELLEMFDDYLLDEKILPENVANLDDPQLVKALSDNEKINTEKFDQLEAELGKRADQPVSVEEIDLETVESSDDEEEDEDEDDDSEDESDDEISEIDYLDEPQNDEQNNAAFAAGNSILNQRSHENISQVKSEPCESAANTFDDSDDDCMIIDP